MTDLLAQLVHQSRALRPRLQVSTTGCVSYVRAHDEAFQDWPSWLNSHLVDFVTIMDYPEDVPTFAKHITDARKRVKDFHKVNVALGAYKLVKAPDVFGHQWKVCETSGAGACVVFHYGSLLENAVLKDRLNKN